MKYFIFILLISFAQSISAQSSLDEVLKQYTDASVAYISIENFAMSKEEAIVLDSRTKEEFAVSHIDNSVFVGHEDFNLNAFKKVYPNQEALIIVYCSIGVRSHTIGKKLIQAGYTKVKNLYGGIFEWKNKEFPVVNLKNLKTDSLHTYSKQWSTYSKNAINVY